MKASRIIKSICSVTGVILLAKLLGFVKQMTSAALFGATVETDLIALSQGVLGDIQYVLAQVLLTAFTAIYIRAREQTEDGADQRFVSDVLKLFTLISVGLSVCVYLAAPLIAKVIAPRYTPELSAALAANLRIYAPILLPFVLSALFQAVLGANARFVPGEMVSVNQSVIFVAVIWLLHRQMGAKSMIVGFFAYVIWNLCFLCILSRKHWRYMRGSFRRNPLIGELLHMMGPLLLGYSMVYVNQQVDKILVSGLEYGSVTAQSYGAVLSNLITAFIVSFGSILFTYIATAISQGAEGEAARLTLRAVALLVSGFLPISLLTVLCARDIVTVAFGRGAFDQRAVQIAAYALAGYGLSFLPLILREVFSRFQYGYQDSKRPMVNSSIGIVCNIALSIALCPHFGVFGVAFASSFSVGVCGVLNAVTARRHNAALQFRQLLPFVPFWLVGGGACCGAAFFLRNPLSDYSPMVRFALTALIGLALYGLILSPVLLRQLRELRQK